jgi:hypothetical protein
MFSSLDILLRNMFSYVYRALLIVFSLCLVCRTENYFPRHYYYVFTAAFYLLFIVLKYKYDKPFLRLLLDFSFIGIILLGKDLNHFGCFFLLLIPFINAPNHSGNNNGFYTYLLVAALLALLSSFNQGEIFWEWKYILPFILIFVIDAFYRLRRSIQTINETLLGIIDAFYAKNIGKKDTSKIYSFLIREMSKLRQTKFLRIGSISSFIVRKESLILVNSSVNILNYDIPDSAKLISRLNSNEMVEDHSIVIDEKNFNNNLFVKVKGNSREYIFLITFLSKKTEINGLRVFFISRMILVPCLKHLARLFEVQYHLITSKVKNLDVIGENQEYVMKANEVMHFVKNSLSPIKSVLNLLEMQDAETDQEKINYLKENIVKQRKSALTEIDNIIKRANFILEKAKNPFESSAIEDVAFFTLFNTIRRRWADKYFNTNITIGLGGHDFKTLDKIIFQLDFNTLHLVITNIFSNIDKYANTVTRLNFELQQDNAVISFVNGIDFSKVQLNELKKLAISYNENKRTEIAKRKSHGFVHLKNYLESMDSTSQILIQDDNTFTLKIKIPFKK